MEATARLAAILAGIVLIMWGIGFDAKRVLEFLFPEAARQTQIEEEREAEEAEARKRAAEEQSRRDAAFAATNGVEDVWSPSDKVD